jgi:hypothetical protein
MTLDAIDCPETLLESAPVEFPPWGVCPKPCAVEKLSRAKVRWVKYRLSIGCLSALKQGDKTSPNRQSSQVLTPSEAPRTTTPGAIVVRPKCSDPTSYDSGFLLAQAQPPLRRSIHCQTDSLVRVSRCCSKSFSGMPYGKTPQPFSEVLAWVNAAASPPRARRWFPGRWRADIPSGWARRSAT